MTRLSFQRFVGLAAERLLHVRIAMKAEKTEPKAVIFGSMMNLLRALTTGEQHMTQCVNYFLGVFVSEIFRKMKGIVTTCVTDIEKRKQLLKDVEAVSAYLKHGYIHPLDKDLDPAHAVHPHRLILLLMQLGS